MPNPDHRGRQEPPQEAAQPNRSGERPATRRPPAPRLELDLSDRGPDKAAAEQKAFTVEYAALRGERGALPPAAKNGLTERERSALASLVEKAVMSDDALGAMVIKEGLETGGADLASHPLNEGTRSLTDKLLDPNGDIAKQFMLLLEMQQDSGAALKALQKKIGERALATLKAGAQKRASAVGTTGLELDYDAKDVPRGSERRPRTAPGRGAEEMAGFTPNAQRQQRAAGDATRGAADGGSAEKKSWWRKLLE